LLDDAQRHYDTSLRQRRAIYGDRHIKVAASLYMQHAIHAALNRPNQSLAVLHEAVQIARTAPAGDMPDLLPHLLTDLAGTLQQQGRLDEAEPAGAEALEMFRKRYGDEHLTVAYAKRALANLRRFRHDRTGAETLLHEAAATIVRLSPPKSNNLSPLLEDLGVLAMERGAYDEAAGFFRDAYDRTVATLGSGHPSVAHNLGLQASAEQTAGRHASAQKLARSALELTRRRHGRGHPATLGSLHILVEVMMQGGKEREAEPHIREALRIWAANQPDDPCEIAKLRVTLAWSLAAQSRAGALPIARDAYPSMIRDCRSSSGYAHLVANMQPMMARHFPSVLKP
jgi:tetratricopeptide (TPR) repeat protein